MTARDQGGKNPVMTGLKRKLGAIHLWSIAVGMVISGQYFGWNYGFEAGGTGGLLVAALVVTVYYTLFIFSYAELSTAIPSAGGPSAHARRALGPAAGFVAGFAVLLEFGFAPPAIAVATGAYLHFLMPALDPTAGTVGTFVVFLLVNLLGIGSVALVELFATIAALVGLLMYIPAGAAQADFSAVWQTMDFHGGVLAGTFAAVPFAIWLYLGIEGAAMAAEEVREPQHDISRGFIAGIATLALCSFGTVWVTAGLGGGEGTPADYPLPQALAASYGTEHVLTWLVATIGLTGLFASLHGILLGLSRQTYALARDGYLPAFLTRTSRRGTPYLALLVPGGLGLLCAGSADFANALIILAVCGSIVMSVMSMASLLVLRAREPELARPYRIRWLWVPWLAMVMGIAALGAVVWFSLRTTALPLFGLELSLPVVLAGLCGLAALYYITIARHRVAQNP